MKKVVIAVVVISVLFVGILIISSKLGERIRSDTQMDALALLKKGNARFVKARTKHPTRSAARRKETARFGQNPYAIVLACSDSRVPVEILFNAGIGDIFVVSNAGNVSLDDVTAGSIEYAAKHLKSPLLVILGHTECGAVQAALSDVHAAGNIRDIQKIIEPAAAEVEKSSPSLRGTELLNAVIKRNTLKSKEDLFAKSEIIRRMSDEGSLKIVTGVYDIETGAITWEE